MADALLMWKESPDYNLAQDQRIQYFLDRFYLNRISIRMLINQHCYLLFFEFSFIIIFESLLILDFIELCFKTLRNFILKIVVFSGLKAELKNLIKF